MALLTNLEAYFKLDGDLVDATGNGHDGSNTGVTFAAGGLSNQGAETLGITSGVGFSPGIALGTVFTARVVVKPASNPLHQGGRTQYGEIFAQDSQNGLFLQQVAAGTLYLELWVSNVLEIQYAVSEGVAIEVVLTCDGATALLYVDGVQVGTAAAAPNWTIVALLSDEGLGSSCAALIDEVGFWPTRVLDSSEVTGLLGAVYPFAAPPPSIASVVLWPSLDPATGPTTGGTAILITGVDFVVGATVTIGGVPATSVLVTGSLTEITCNTPPGYAGARDVVVTNPNTESDTLIGGFTYAVAAPVFTTYGEQLTKLLPPGKLWHLEGNSELQRTMVAVGDEFARVHARGADLIEESDPRTATETLAEWEQMLSLPDDLVTEIPATTAGRQVAVTAKYVARGGSNATFYETLCAACGYPLVSITRYANEVLRCGPTTLAAGFVFRVNDRVYGADYAYAILITVDPATAGALTHAEFEAVIRARTHSHIQVMFTYL